MDNKEPNILDKFLNKYDELNTNRKSYQRIYKKPSKLKCITGLLFSVICFIFLIKLFVFKFFYFVFLIADLLIVSYYGINLFTEKGFALPTTVAAQSDQPEQNNQEENITTTNNESTYRIDR